MAVMVSQHAILWMSWLGDTSSHVPAFWWKDKMILQGTEKEKKPVLFFLILN